MGMQFVKSLGEVPEGRGFDDLVVHARELCEQRKTEPEAVLAFTDWYNNITERSRLFVATEPGLLEVSQDPHSAKQPMYDSTYDWVNAVRLGVWLVQDTHLGEHTKRIRAAELRGTRPEVRVDLIGDDREAAEAFVAIRRPQVG
jgi:hypothetical protein